MSDRSRRLVPALMLGVAVFFWGTSFVAAKFALDAFSPMTVMWLRMVIASVAFAPFWLTVPKPRYQAGDWKLLTLTGLLMPCLYFTFEAYAIHFTTSGQAGVISAIVPLLVAVGAWLFLKERISRRSAFAIAFSLVGVAALSLGGHAQESATNPVLGNLLEVLAMTCSAGWMLVTKYLTPRYNPWFLVGFQSLVGVVFFLPGALASHPATWLAAPASAWIGVVYLGVAVSLGAFGLYNTAQSMMPASRAAISVNMIPAISLLAGWMLRGERLTLLQLAACGLIVGAVVFAELGPEPPPQTEPAG